MEFGHTLKRSDNSIADLVPELCADELVVGGGVGWSYNRRRRRGFIVGGGGGVRPDERALKQRTRWTGVFSGFTGVSQFICDLRWAASVEKLTVNMHAVAVHNFTVLVS